MRLDSGSSFDIIGWKRVPKPKSSEAIESDVAPKAGSAQQGYGADPDSKEKSRRKQEETNELWYKVRLSPTHRPRRQVGFTASRLSSRCRATSFFIAPAVSLLRGNGWMARAKDNNARIKMRAAKESREAG